RNPLHQATDSSRTHIDFGGHFAILEWSEKSVQQRLRGGLKVSILEKVISGTLKSRKCAWFRIRNTKTLRLVEAWRHWLEASDAMLSDRGTHQEKSGDCS
ncbi:hypothetical protein, partial [Vibrio anguillarum]